ncbi:TolB family protein [Chloroflexota bacterium]
MICNRQYYAYKISSLIMLLFLFFYIIVSTLGCSRVTPTETPLIPSTDEDALTPKVVPHIDRWGIYVQDIATEETELLYSSTHKISFLNLNKAGDSFAFSQQFDGDSNDNEEICTLTMVNGVFTRLTNNRLWDIYPVWSPDGTRIAFLSWRDEDLDIFVMEQNGLNQRKLYDSGSHDADIDWVGERIVFTSESQIWVINDSGDNPTQITEPPKAGIWGDANLPFGDYDPRLNPDGNNIAFERLEDDTSLHGNYNIYVINYDGSGEIRLTNTSYSQGIVSWSHKGDKMVFVVGAIKDEGKYDIYMMSGDGSNVINITPTYFPSNFLCHTPVFSIDDSKIFFIGEWWE